MAKDEILIRWATVEDAAVLVKLNDEFNGPGATIPDVEDSLANSKELVALALKGEKAVGFASAQYFKSFCYPHLCGEITELYVVEKARGQGTAALLISFLEEELQRRGVRSFKVLTGHDNEPAIKTYEKNRYVRVEEIVLEKEFD